MTRPRSWLRRPRRWGNLALSVLLVATFVLWLVTSPRALLVLSRIGYALALALPPVLLIGGALAVVYYIKSRTTSGRRSKDPPSRRR